MKSYQNIVQDKFAEGFNCAQATFFPHAIETGIDPTTALKLTTGFGAGMIYRGEMCGAITGSMMAIGLKTGRFVASDIAARDITYKLIEELHKQFIQKHGSIQCKELLQLSGTNTDAWKKAQELFKTKCPVYVKDAALITEKILKEYDNDRH